MITPLQRAALDALAAIARTGDAVPPGYIETAYPARHDDSSSRQPGGAPVQGQDER